MEWYKKCTDKLAILILRLFSFNKMVNKIEKTIKINLLAIKHSIRFFLNVKFFKNFLFKNYYNTIRQPNKLTLKYLGCAWDKKFWHFMGPKTKFLILIFNVQIKFIYHVI
jgi:hypothetical protein